MNTRKELSPEIENLLTKEQKRMINRAIHDNSIVIITGPQGPTGKTRLKNALRELGAQAYEPHEITEISLRKHMNA